MSGLAPRALGDSVRPRRLPGASGRPLNFTVSSHETRTRRAYAGACARKRTLWVAVCAFGSALRLAHHGSSSDTAVLPVSKARLA